MSDPGIIQQALNTAARIADSLDRLVALAEDLAAAVELPALNRDAAVYEEDLEEQPEEEED
jgi:hypothetical protein